MARGWEVEGACLGNGSCLQLYLGRRLPSSSEPISLVRKHASRVRTSKTDKSGWGSALGRGLSTRPPRASSVRAHSSLHFAIHRYYFIYSLSTRIPESASSRRKRNAMSMLNSALSRRPCPRNRGFVSALLQLSSQLDLGSQRQSRPRNPRHDQRQAAAHEDRASPHLRVQVAAIGVRDERAREWRPR